MATGSSKPVTTRDGRAVDDGVGESTGSVAGVRAAPFLAQSAAPGHPPAYRPGFARAGSRRAAVGRAGSGPAAVDRIGSGPAAMGRTALPFLLPLPGRCVQPGRSGRTGGR